MTSSTPPQTDPEPADRITIDVPCSADWGAMSGDDRKRFCGACKLHVYNVAELTRPEVNELIDSSEGRLCMRIYRRIDGTIVTKDCVSLVAAARRRMKLAAAALVAALGLGAAGAHAALVARDHGGVDSAATWRQQPFRSLAKFLPRSWVPQAADDPFVPTVGDPPTGETPHLMGEVTMGDIAVAPAAVPTPDAPQPPDPATPSSEDAAPGGGEILPAHPTKEPREYLTGRVRVDPVPPVPTPAPNSE